MDKIGILKQQATFHLLTFLSRNRDRWPRWIINAALFAAALIVAGLWLSATHPAAGEIWQKQLITIFLTAVTITAAGLGLAIARGIWLSAPELMRDMPPALSLPEKVFLVFGVRIGETPALPVSTWMPPDARPDILVCTLPGEGPEQFDARMEDAIEQANVARWVVVLQQGNPMGMIYGAPDSVSEFKRNNPPFQTENWLQEQRIVPADTRFRGETETEFQGYVERFMLHFPEWSAIKKVTGEKTRAGFVFQQIVKATSVVLFLLFSVAAFAQKSAKVEATKIGKDVPDAGVEVSYIFQKTDLYRTGNGKDNYADLLKNVPGYRDGGGGELLAIMAGGKAVYKASQTGDVAGQPATKAATMRPYNEAVPEGRLHVPDSAGMVEMADRAKYEIWKASNMIEDAAAPWWEVFMYAFWRWSWLIGLAIMLSWLWAAVGAEEGFWDVHRYAKRVLILSSLGVGSLFAVNIYLWVMAQGAPGWALFFVAFIEAAVIYWIIKRLNPDYRPAKGNTPRRPINPYNQPELPG